MLWNGGKPLRAVCPVHDAHTMSRCQKMPATVGGEAETGESKAAVS